MKWRKTSDTCVWGMVRGSEQSPYCELGNWPIFTSREDTRVMACSGEVLFHYWLAPVVCLDSGYKRTIVVVLFIVAGVARKQHNTIAVWGRPEVGQPPSCLGSLKGTVTLGLRCPPSVCPTITSLKRLVNGACRSILGQRSLIDWKTFLKV